MSSINCPAIKIRRLDNAIDISVPTYMTDGAAGADVAAAIMAPVTIAPGTSALIPTGFAMQVPDGFEIQIRPRSGLALHQAITVHHGTVDSDYRGSVGVILINHGDTDFTVSRGDRIAQIVVTPVARAVFEEVDELATSSRGDAGFGSTNQHA